MCSPEQLCKEQIDDYLYYCSNLHKTPSESFFKHTVFGLRAAYKVMGMEDMRIKRQNSLHPHLHCIVPSGGVTKSGNWKNTKSKNGKNNPKFLFPVKSMSKVFSAKFIAELRKELPDLPQSLYDALFKKKWVVFAKSAFKTNKSVIEYLGRYTHKIAISNYRIRHINKEKRTVTFSLKDYKKGGLKTTQTLSSKEFVRRFSMHILPRGFTRIRHFGILSSA